MHALEEYGVMQVKLYEDIARFGHIATTYAYPVKVNGRYVMDPSPIPKFDNPKMDMMPACSFSVPGAKTHLRRSALHPRGKSRFRRSPVYGAGVGRAVHHLRIPNTAIWTKWCWTIRANGCLSAPTPITAANRARRTANENRCFRLIT